MIYTAVFVLNRGTDIRSLLVNTEQQEPAREVVQRSHLCFVQEGESGLKIFKDRSNIFTQGWTAPPIEETELVKWIQGGMSTFQFHSHLIARRPIDPYVT